MLETFKKYHTPQKDGLETVYEDGTRLIGTWNSRLKKYKKLKLDKVIKKELSESEFKGLETLFDSWDLKTQYQFLIENKDSVHCLCAHENICIIINLEKEYFLQICDDIRYYDNLFEALGIEFEYES